MKSEGSRDGCFPDSAFAQNKRERHGKLWPLGELDLWGGDVRKRLRQGPFHDLITEYRVAEFLEFLWTKHWESWIFAEIKMCGFVLPFQASLSAFSGALQT